MRDYGLEGACAYVQVRDNIPFLKEQKDVAYTALLLDEDIHRAYVDEKLDIEYLRKLEHDIGNPTLWQFIGADRVIRFGQLVREYPYAEPLYEHHDLMRLAQAYAKRITEFLDKEKPDFVFMPQPGGLGTLLLEALAKKRGIPVQMIIITGLTERTCVSDGYAQLTGVEKILSEGTLKESHCAEARRLIQEFRDKPRPYSHVYDSQYTQYTRKRQLDFLTPSGLYRSVVWGFPLVVARWFKNSGARDDYTTTRPWHYLFDRVVRKFRNAFGYADLYDAYDPHAEYAFFPLHLEPEIALLVQAPYAKNQIEIADMIAQSLPVGMLLYVKEHPLMVGYRTRAFYKALKNTPNVRLLDPSLKGVDVMQNSKLVFTIAGSSGFEAARLKKPVISFGEFYYNSLSCVKRSTEPEKLAALIREQLNKNMFDDEELEKFVAAILQDSARVDFAHLWAYVHDVPKMREELKDLIRVVAQKVGLVSSASHR
jgi:hypothetical protein